MSLRNYISLPRFRLLAYFLLAVGAFYADYRMRISAADNVLIPTSSTWKYLDDGSTPSSGWKTNSFNDNKWRSGQAQLGYGDGDEKTVIRYGSDSRNKHITTYFRRTFSVSNPFAYKALLLRLLVDDGAIVYLNGNEVIRMNMPVGTIGSSSRAKINLVPPEERTYYSFDLRNTLLTGTNILAVEVHQVYPSNDDLSFDASLIGTNVLRVSSGPYLQSLTPNSAVLRWKTNFASNSVVRYGSTPSSLTASASSSSAVNDHTVKLSGLSPNKKYFYSIGSTQSKIEGADSSHFFVTAPAKGSTLATRIWIIGDSGTWNSKAAAVRNAYTGSNGSRYTNLWLMLGDNAYTYGTDVEYKLAVFNMYPNLLRQTVLWPTYGNHDALSADSARQSGTYYSVFTLPRAGEAGGIASNTEAYYSFDFANIHFVSLDSQESSRSPSGSMLTWLKKDLAATTQKWLIAFWHSPPYSRGKDHNSDTDKHMTEMRQNVNPILEDHGVDLVLGGHSHSYERSYLIDHHYGTSSTFTSSMKLNGGSGRTDGSGAYRKATYGLAPHQGTVYMVMGSSGKVSTGPLNYPAMYYSTATLGSVVVDINGNRLDAKMLSNTRAVKDYFTIIKGSSTSSTSLAAPSGLSATAISTSQIRLRWNDNSSNEAGFKIERSIDGASFGQIAVVGSNGTSFTNSGLAASRRYYYRVRAYNSSGNSSYSNTASAVTSGSTSAGVPNAPSNLVASALNRSQIRITWRDNSTNEAGFKMELSGDGVTFRQVAIVAPNTVRYVYSGLRAGHRYYLRIRAYNSAGNSPYSNTGSATTFP